MSFKTQSKFKNTNILFKNSSNITGLTKINNNSNINQNYEFIKKTKTINHNSDKINLIRKMINKPLIKLPYDGFAIQYNKCTVEALLQKTCENEKVSLFEKNKLCKNNYPLIKFLSNRKNKNNTKELLIEILNTEFGELSKAQENIIKYKRYKPKSKEIRVKLNLKNESMKKYISYPKLLDNKTISLSRKNKFEEKGSFTQRMKLSYPNKILNKFALNLKNTINYNNRPETERVYHSLGFGETVFLDNHKTSKKNNKILLNRFIRKNYISKKEKPDFLQNYIINDISKLKYHKKIMPLYTEILTL